MISFLRYEITFSPEEKRMEEKFTKLRSILATVADLRGATAVLTWDQETHMPEGGGFARASQLATLEKLGHDLFITDEVGELLDDLADLAKDPSDTSFPASLIRVTKRDYDKARKLPSSLVEAFSRATSEATQIWRKARSSGDYELFLPHLTHLLELTREKAHALGFEERLYDALIDQFEPDMKTGEVESVLSDLKKRLVPFVHAITARKAPENGFLHIDYDEEDQRTFVLDVLKDFGFDFSRGIQDFSTHPLTIAFSPDDVRITIRVRRNLLPFALFSAFHECGHALYYQGIGKELDRSPLNEGASTGMHESQSRFWENIVGSSLAFWNHYYPALQSRFSSQLGNVDVNAFYRAINRVEPGLIRIEADEVTYNLHIVIRFELENALLEGDLDPRDLPAAWNEKMQNYLGVVPSSPEEGAMQDIHWASGAFGYFPTYTLGNIMSGQLYAQMRSELPDIEEEIAHGRFSTILDWLREKIHIYGRCLTSPELLMQVTGRGLEADSYVSYIRGKYTGIYGDLP
ncbi:MAG TPA: carboxypeptidase M32 [Thermoanaerobaculia bacterium]|nr:carboxypeptidase M32 [Thermoanaerobaculia bacterium]HXK68977.1 carboxypeptidase M32 [Thermoanaerobaculia bacterium]